jgi:ribosome-binding factor A
MKRSRRMERLNGVFLQEISGTVLREVSDPRIRSVTFTAVDVTPDLRLARVYFSVWNAKQDQEEAFRGLQSAKGVIKRELGNRLQLRYMPDLEFIFDPSMQHAEEIDRLLKQIETRDPGSVES